MHAHRVHSFSWKSNKTCIKMNSLDVMYFCFFLLIEKIKELYKCMFAAFLHRIGQCFAFNLLRYVMHQSNPVFYCTQIMKYYLHHSINPGILIITIPSSFNCFRALLAMSSAVTTCIFRFSISWA